MKVVILAGGGGTRLWPLSRQSTPKQVLSILGKGSLLQQTYARLRIGFDKKDILISTGQEYERQVREHISGLPRNNIIVEPCARDSAGAIGLAASLVARDNPNEVLISVASDHWVDDGKKFVNLLKSAAQTARNNPDYTVLTGIKPLYPETGYGYIELDKKIVQEKEHSVYRVKRFIEKPKLLRARRFLEAKNFLWNPSWFAWRVDHLLSLFKEFLPKSYSVFSEITSASKKDLDRKIEKMFPRVESVAIDYGILEKAKKLLVLKTDIAWSDIGHWRSVAEMSQKDESGNVVNSRSILLDCKNNLISSQSKKLIAAIGVEDVVVIETNDAILVASKERAHEVKQIVEIIKGDAALKKYL